MNNDLSALEGIIRKNYSVSISSFLRRGWEIFNNNVGGFIGFFILAIVINTVSSKIPGIGLIANIIMSSVLSAGFYIVAFKIAKGQGAEFGDFFKGFQNSYFGSVILASLLVGIFTGLLSLPFLVSIFLALYRQMREFVLANSADVDVASLPEIIIPGSTIWPLLIIGILLLIPAIYLGIAYSFTIPLIADRRLKFWSAMETSRRLLTHKWFAYFGFYFVLGLINLGGLLACGVGLLLTVPLTMCAIAAAYESIVGLSNAAS